MDSKDLHTFFTSFILKLSFAQLQLNKCKIYIKIYNIYISTMHDSIYFFMTDKKIYILPIQGLVPFM